jgi:hypothetical protein
VRWALAAQAAAIFLLAGVLLGRTPAPSGALFRTLSDPRPELAAPAPERLRLRVTFAEAATVGELRAALVDLGAEIVAGPSPTGVYTVEVAARRAIERSVVERFTARPEIEFATPVAHRSTLAAPGAREDG